MHNNTKSRKQYYSLEKFMKGAANHWRIQMLDILDRCGGLSTDDIVGQANINYQTGSAHVRSLVRSGLVSTHREGRVVSHELTPYGKKVISFLKKL